MHKQSKNWSGVQYPLKLPIVGVGQLCVETILMQCLQGCDYFDCLLGEIHSPCVSRTCDVLKPGSKQILDTMLLFLS